MLADRYEDGLISRDRLVRIGEIYGGLCDSWYNR